MALRSRSRTATATSGPGRGPRSDGRSRHRRPPGARERGRPRHAASAEELRRRAEVLFAERAGGVHPGSGVDVGGVGEGGSSGGEGPPGVDAREIREAWSSGGGRLSGEAWPSEDEGSAREVRPSADGVPARDARPSGGRRWGLDASGSSGSGERRSFRDDGVEAWPGAPSGLGGWRERVGPALRERLPVWVQARCGLERRNVVALSVLLVVAAVFAAQHFWTGRPQSVQAPEVVRAAAPFGEGGQGKEQPGPTAAAGVPSAGGQAGAEIVVDVGGKVREPGVKTLPAGSRVADALRAAGGVRPGTNTDALNRARFLVDGEQVVVGGTPAPVPGAGGAPVAGGAVGAGAAPVSLNTATVDQLDTLPGVGPVLAQHIVDYRTQHGGFRSVDELREVNGIGDRRFADLRDLVRP
ncbi:ComEA family DNA-binding protein [Streptomyces sp. NPDC047072]|uniref:ComEA family DNA-binding protein n=1 Tax=Streptomyces sp. NPDC047072 TaxID=3154809 RepID=UPI0033D947CA